MWSDDENLIILNVGVLLLFWIWIVWVRFNIHDVTDKEQLVAYYGVTILLNISNLADQAVLYCLYGVVPLFNKKTSRMKFFVALLTSFPSTTFAPPFTDKKPPKSKQRAPKHNISPPC